MPGTFTDTLDRNNEWTFWFTMKGIGRRVGATSSALRNQTIFTTRHPYRHGYTAADCDQYLNALVANIRTIGESIDIRTGKTRLGTIELNITTPSFWNYDGSRTDQGWGDDPVLNMMAVFGPAHSTHTATNGQWRLDTDVSATDAVFSLETVSGLSAGDALWIEGEVVIVVIVGVSSITVARGMYGTEAKPHKVIGPLSEGVLYDRPKFLRGRDIELYAQLMENGIIVPDSHDWAGAKQMLPFDQAKLIWSGTLDDWEYPAGGPIRLACKPDLGKLDRAIGRNCINTKTETILDDADDFAAQGYEIELLLKDTATHMGEPDTFDYPAFGSPSVKRFYARMGDELVLAESTSVSGDPLVVTITDRGCLGTEFAELTDSVKFNDVLVTAENPYSFFRDSSNNATSHPIDIMLSLITSTGTYDGTAGSGDNGDWDCLPENWGAGFPIGRINTQSFRDLRSRSHGAKFTRLVIGWDGKPVPLRDFITKNILGPMGWFLYMGIGEDGDYGLSIGTISDQYPKEYVDTLDENDIIQGSWQMQGQLRQTLSIQTFRYEKNLATGEYGQVSILRRPEVMARYPNDDSEISYDVPGIVFGETSSSIMEGRANNFGEWFATPLPLVGFTVSLSRLEVSVTEKILLNMPDVPNPFTGGRGLVNRAAIVLAAKPAPTSGNRSGIEMTCMLIPERNTGLWAPCGVVKDWDGAYVITFEENFFTEADAGYSIPIRDVLAFNLDDSVMLLDRFGNIKSSGYVEITSPIESDGPNTIRVDGLFSSDPEAGDRVVYVHYSTSSSASPKAGWRDDMKNVVAQADASTNLLPNGDPANQYGN